MANIQVAVLHLWRRLSRFPGGRWLFGRALARAVPYSATIRPQVQVLEPGHAELLMLDRRGVRNHLHSVHAIALANLGELASGLAMNAALSPSIRGIVTRLEIEYTKKARGPILATSDARPPDSIEEPVDLVVESSLTDQVGDRVALVRVHWRLAPRPLP